MREIWQLQRSTGRLISRTRWRRSIDLSHAHYRPTNGGAERNFDIREPRITHVPKTAHALRSVFSPRARSDTPRIRTSFIYHEILPRKARTRPVCSPRSPLRLRNMTPRISKSLTESKADPPAATGARVLNIFPILPNVALFSLLTSCLTASVLDIVRVNFADPPEPDEMACRWIPAESAVVSEMTGVARAAIIHDDC